MFLVGTKVLLDEFSYGTIVGVKDNADFEKPYLVYDGYNYTYHSEEALNVINSAPEPHQTLQVLGQLLFEHHRTIETLLNSVDDLQYELRKLGE